MGPENDLYALLEKRCGSEEKATAALHSLSLELGLGRKIPTDSLAGIALIRLGFDAEKVASTLDWNEFEDLCAKLLTSSGYEVRRNIVLTKPRKQIDVFATSSLMSLSVDCKHYMNSISPYSLVRFAGEQLERTRLYKQRQGHNGPILPMILTLFDAISPVVDGVPVVPLLRIRSFLQSVSPYDGFAVV